MPIVGSGTGIRSFRHIDDAAAATFAAATRGASGVYNIVDDEPARCRVAARPRRAVGAKPPMRVPAWVARMLIGEFGVADDDPRGASNAKARAELGGRRGTRPGGGIPAPVSVSVQVRPRGSLAK